MEELWEISYEGLWARGFRSDEGPFLTICKEEQCITLSEEDMMMLLNTLQNYEGRSKDDQEKNTRSEKTE